jgi:hypothetical protein
VAFSDGLPSKARGGATLGGFSSTPYLVGSTRAASNRRGSGELFGTVAVDGAKVFMREPGRGLRGRKGRRARWADSRRNQRGVPWTVREEKPYSIFQTIFPICKSS